MGINRIEKDFAHYSSYRQNMSAQRAVNSSFELRMNQSISDVKRGVKMTSYYTRVSLETSTKNSVEESHRIHAAYNSKGIGSKNPLIGHNGTTHQGIYIDIKI